MPILVNTSISGTGVELFGSSTAVRYVGLRFTTISSDVRYLEPLVTDRMLRAGWLAIGWNDPTDGDAWLEPFFANFEWSWWQHHQAAWADAEWDRIRYHLANGCAADLVVGS